MSDTERATVLLADDEDTLRNNLALVLQEEGFDVIACADGSKALHALKRRSVDALITDLRMAGVCGMDLIAHARKLAPDAIIIVITAFGQVETAVEAMKAGAQDYICKPLIFDEVIFKLKRLLAHDHLEKENKLLREQIRKTQWPVQLIGQSEAIKNISETIQRIAQTTSSVLICGESGTGKEVVARAIHYSGVTREKPFVAVNCGGLTDSLIESELFGHRRGAFTGADADHPGYFEAANGGTLFLDEIGNLPYHTQAVLLRSIEERAVTRVGDITPRPVNLRIVTATNRDLERAIEAGEFREDLFFRLNVIRIVIPPLRERREDIPLLIEHFVKKYNAELNRHCPGFTPDAVDLLCGQSWRGNVRELENVVEHALIFNDDEPVDVEGLALAAGCAAPVSVGALELKAATRAFERRHILQVLARFDHNKSATAEALGIGLSSLYRKMEELEIAAKAPNEAVGTT
ncbi:MAG: sigma-54-dependent Fis family transcriptional regulator [Planctomycetes bacterium]|nr:sigma-54-dependent Fis family transcriptional regulator [Planctomycetota bacterium]